MKSFCALIWSSQLIGGINSEAPILAFLNISLMSGFSCSPAPVVISPSLNAYQRPISSSRVMICATRLCSFTRALNFGCRLAACLRSCAAPNRMTGNLSLANAMVPPGRLDPLSCDLYAGRTWLAGRRSEIHRPLDLACARDGQRRKPGNRPLRRPSPRAGPTVRLPRTARSPSKIGAAMPTRPGSISPPLTLEAGAPQRGDRVRETPANCRRARRPRSPAASWANSDFNIRVGRCARMIFEVAPRNSGIRRPRSIADRRLRSCGR